MHTCKVTTAGGSPWASARWIAKLSAVAVIVGLEASAFASCPPGVPCLPEDLAGSYDTSDETRAALFMLGLQRKGVVGGASGICVDYVPASKEGSEPEFKIGFSSDAFVTGKSDINSTKLDLSKIRDVVKGLYEAQGSKALALRVDGFADGQHYDGKKVEDSIKANEALSLRRATLIRDQLMASSSNWIVPMTASDVAGYASPLQERDFLPPREVKCDTRRKVVISAKLGAPEIHTQSKGASYFPQLQMQSSQQRKKIVEAFDESVAAASEAIKKRRDEAKKRDRKNLPEADDPKAVMDEMIAQGAVVPQCRDHELLRELTLAAIRTSMDLGDSSASESKDWTESLKEWSAYDRFIDEKKTGSGKPTDRFWCFVAPFAKPHDPDLSAREIKRDPGELFFKAGARSGAELIPKLKAEKLPADATLGIGFDPSKLQMQDVTGADRKKSKKRGFVCGQCGHGVSFEPTLGADGKITSYAAVVNDRMLKHPAHMGAKDRDAMYDALQTVSDANPFTVAALSRPRTYIIPNCEACNCDLRSRLGGKDVQVVDPLSHRNDAFEEEQVSKETLAKACVFSPPVIHSCIVSPQAGGEAKESVASSSFSFYNPVTAMTEEVGDLQQAAESIVESGNSCSARTGNEKPFTFQERINDASCSGKPSNRLPSSDPEKERDDCAAEIAAAKSAYKIK